MTTGGSLRADERPAPAVPEAFCDVFLSYARRDLKLAEPLRAALVREGLSVWVDQSGIQAAAPWREEIASALASGTAVAQCWLQLVVASLSEATPSGPDSATRRLPRDRVNGRCAHACSHGRRGLPSGGQP
jgi:hypothetical protein